MRQHLLAAGTLCTALLGGGLAAATPAAAAPAPGSTLTIGGAVQSIANNGPTETLVVARPNGRVYNVTLAATTTVEMRGGMATTYSALIPGDRVRVTGTLTTPATRGAPGTLSAVDVRDLSLVTRTGIVGVVRSVPSPGQIVILVGRRGDDGFVGKGQIVTVDVTASTPVSLSAGMTGTATLASLVPNTVVRVAGVYDSDARTVVATESIIVVAATARVDDRDHHRARRHRACDEHLVCLRGHTYIVARLLSAPITTTVPVSLNVRIASGPVISVTVAPTTTIVRRYNGASNLSELVAGDLLRIRGAFEAAPARTFDASRITDVSEQEAFTSALIRLSGFSYDASTNTATGMGRVLIDVRHAPYWRGETLKLAFASTTAVYNNGGSAGSLAQLSTLSFVRVSGRYDRRHHTLYVLRVQV